LKLAQFEFNIEYRPGKYIQHEDALSRLIAAVSRDPQNQKNIQRQQVKDSFCHEIRETIVLKGSIIWIKKD